MAVNSADYASNVADTGRGPSMSIWKDCPVVAIQEDPSLGMHFWDDFQGGSMATINAASTYGSNWLGFADTTTVFTDLNEEGGVPNFNHATGAKGLALGGNGGSFKVVSGASGFPLGQKLWFECRIAVGTIAASLQGMFVGLCDNTSTLVNASAATILATSGATLTGTKGMMGFFWPMGTTTDWKFIYQVAGGSTISPTGLTTVITTVTGTAPTAYAAVTNGNGTGFYKLGFLFDPSPGNVARNVTTASGDGTVTQTAGALLKPMLQIFVNGMPAPAFIDSSMIQTSRFPSKRMAPALSFQSNSASAVGVSPDWIRVAQLASF